jgi:hypothetical protein
MQDRSRNKKDLVEKDVKQLCVVAHDFGKTITKKKRDRDMKKWCIALTRGGSLQIFQAQICDSKQNCRSSCKEPWSVVFFLLCDKTWHIV